MIEHRPFDSLATFDLGWLETRHHFSFANYFDPDRMGWGRVRVWNDDLIEPETGFPLHPHQDMEIITYVRKGAISHKDSLGNQGRTEAGNVQVMSAGTGIRHEEWNHEKERTEIFQIWILPSQAGGKPHWENVAFPKDGRDGKWIALASGQAAHPDAAPIRTDATIYGATLNDGAVLEKSLDPGRHYYLVVADGAVEVNGTRIGTRDSLAISEENVLEIKALGSADVLLADTL